MGLLDQNYKDQKLTDSEKKKIKPAIQGGGPNYLGKQETVTVPKKWLSDPDHVVAELAYITPKEKKILLEKNLYGSLKGKPNTGPAGIQSLQGDMGSVGGGGSSGGGGGGGGGRDYSSVPASKPTVSAPTYSGGGGGQDMSSVPASTPSVGNGNDGRLDYITGDYLDINLTPDQKEQYQDYRENVEEAINPMAKPSNIAIGIGLNALIPGAGYLFGHYKQSTAMGYGMTNPLNGLTDKFGNAKNWITDKLGGLLNGSTNNFVENTIGQGDGDRNTMNTLAPLAPYIVSETTPKDSQARKWYNSIGENTESTFNFAQAYADAKTKVTNNLRNHGPLAQLAVSDSPYYDWLKVNKMDKGIL